MDRILHFNEQARDAFVANVARSLPRGTRMLDAGAGTCKYRPLFAHCDYKAQDFGAYQGSDHSYGSLDYVCDITSIPAPSGSFDAILCTEVFEHVPRPDLAVAEFSRLLRSGGKLFITAPLGSGIHMAPYHFYGGFSPYWYDHFLPMNGFRIESCQANGGFFKLYGQESQRFLALVTPKNPAWARGLLFPFKLLVAPWFKILMPLAGWALDGLDQERNFTVGYFVTAEKK